jgi:mannose-6-phosphate isomerase-like protein (cupin superfamily)
VWNRARPHDRRERLFGGRGAVLVWNLCEAGVRSPFGAVLACELEAGASVGPHRQEDLAEVVIVLEGDGVAHVGGGAVHLRPGAVVDVPLGTTLALLNGSPERPLRYLIVKAR